MKFLRAISRFVIGIVFLFSGYVKIIDPVGGGLVIEEYLNVIGIAGWHSFGVWTGALLAIAEMLCGVAILVGLRVRFFSGLVLGLMLFFTILTFFLAVFDPVSDCGCFGEALKLTNWQTFFKNIVLLFFALLLFMQRQRFVPVAPVRLEWAFTSILLLLLAFLSVYSYRNLPMVDFMEFRVGTNLRERLANDQEQGAGNLETILIYEKEGKEYEFSIENLPDSSFTFLDSHTKSKGNTGSNAIMDFAVSDKEGRYVTDSILSVEGALFVATTPDAKYIGNRRARRLERLQDSLDAIGSSLILFSGSASEDNDRMKMATDLEIDVYHVDKKSLYTLNRSFGGVVYLNRGTIVSKWSSSGVPYHKLREIVKDDPELVAATARIREHLAVESIAFAMLLLIGLMRYLLRLFYKIEDNEIGEREES
ncbi:MAG: DoxX family protein [Bacteroidales bacterium]|jgi:uncharacterized membrane protein YphA (DoxX/SURF4 family)|nr:DoxX family protein [Bacteroidales bacterium]MDD3299498.1 DoxX family protein [Bacteroidales bacterium]MDD3844244.1 DoxX family protein [Bacteroidales bacterium]MDD4618672.1 DoxX family protein [Bacteroidales bacterium]